METCKDLAGERCHAPGREQDRNKPLHENACAPNKKLRINYPDTRYPAVPAVLRDVGCDHKRQALTGLGFIFV